MSNNTISALSVSLLLTFLVFSTTSASPELEWSQIIANLTDSYTERVQICMKKMKLEEIPTLIINRDLKQISYNLGCSISCILEMHDMITDDGKIDVEKFVLTFDTEESINIRSMMGRYNGEYFEICAGETNTKTFEDNCEMLADTSLCILSKRFHEYLQSQI